ncbi:MAG: alpha/beta hydrolase [Alphaproteobacteria bacterium]|nr:alpha/beta hydrolase [Alphaproteobacteria bacterium]
MAKIAVEPGVALDYLERGDASGLPILLLHGYTDSRQSYQPLLATLPVGLRLIAVSHRGHGESDKPASRYDTAELATDVAHFMDALGIDRAVIVGHSMSSQVAQRFAALCPERTLALILIGAFASLKDNAEIAALREGVAMLSDPVDPVFAREFQRGTLAQPVPSWFFETIVAESLKAPAHVWRSALDALIAEDDAACHAAITAPTLILWGDKDRIGSHAQQAQIVASIRGARLTAYRGIGHSPHWEAPHRVAADIAAFLDTIPLGRRAA